MAIALSKPTEQKSAQAKPLHTTAVPALANDTHSELGGRLAWAWADVGW
ncbi:MAG: hypothetical protein MH252_04860 [Thermosynechococcaceae cyanobacterium MS004]|nr:hypothetical protein [Thermosynechococcaceae cyanobacterium MS004]